jgi:hypothetical protein
MSLRNATTESTLMTPTTMMADSNTRDAMKPRARLSFWRLMLGTS